MVGCTYNIVLRLTGNHVCVIDEEGMSIACIRSMNDVFAGSCMVPDPSYFMI